MSEKKVTVAVEDVVAQDPVLRQLVDTSGAARAALSQLASEGVKIPLSLVVFARMVDAHRRRAGRPPLAPLASVHRDEAYMTPEQIEVGARQWPAPGRPTMVSVPARDGITWVDHTISFANSAARVGAVDSCLAEAIALANEFSDRTLRPEWTQALRARVSEVGVTRLISPTVLGVFTVLHPDSVMPLRAPQGFLQLDATSFEIVRDIVDRQGVQVVGVIADDIGADE